MPSARGSLPRAPRAPSFVPALGACLALLALACLPAAQAEAATADAEVEVSTGLETPLIASEQLDLDVAADGVDISVQGPLLPAATLDVPLVGVRTEPDRPQAPPPAAAPAPETTPLGLPEAAGTAVGQAAGAITIGVAIAAPAMPWEAAWAAVSSWLNQARDATRSIWRPVGRALRALPFLVPLFARIDGERLLENPVRARVNETVGLDPGLSLQDVRDRAGIAWGTTVHHLARLERHGLVVSVRHGNHRRYFPSNTVSSRQRRELAALSHPTAHRIAEQVSANPGSDQKGICQALDLRNPAASKHLTRFERLGLVQSEIVGRSRLYHPTELMASVLGTMRSLGGLAPRPGMPDATEERIPSTHAPTHLPLVDALAPAPMRADVAMAN